MNLTKNVKGSLWAPSIFLAERKCFVNSWLTQTVSQMNLNLSLRFRFPLNSFSFPLVKSFGLNEFELLHETETSPSLYFHYDLQIVECRRVLKWTYAYGYYLPEIEHAKRQFFEYLQGVY